ncbi:hypothetical protein [Synechococcus phage Yong-M3-232]|nr:hypothetical protein [Synechococcus phage Yong-M3-232]
MGNLSANIAVPVAVSSEKIGGDEVNAVDARELHRWLDIGRPFAGWFRQRVREYGFEEGVDWSEVFSETGKNHQGGRPRREYLITIDMAKELAMVERNERGRQARRYFIACEKSAKQAALAQLQSEATIDKLGDLMLHTLSDPAKLQELLLVYVEAARDTQTRARNAQMQVLARQDMRITIPLTLKQRLTRRP